MPRPALRTANLINRLEFESFVALYFALASIDTGDLVEGSGRLWIMELKPRSERDFCPDWQPPSGT